MRPSRPRPGRGPDRRHPRRRPAGPCRQSRASRPPVAIGEHLAPRVGLRAAQSHPPLQMSGLQPERPLPDCGFEDLPRERRERLALRARPLLERYPERFVGPDGECRIHDYSVRHCRRRRNMKGIAAAGRLVLRCWSTCRARCRCTLPA